MNKFNPKKVPSWCKWIAVDKSGECCAYRKKPKPNADFNGYPALWCGHCVSDADYVTLYRGKPPKNWKDELYTWR